jgi:hypothetical protein
MMPEFDKVIAMRRLPNLEVRETVPLSVTLPKIAGERIINGQGVLPLRVAFYEFASDVEPTIKSISFTKHNNLPSIS